MGTFSTRINLTERAAAAARPTTAKSRKGAPCARLYLDTRQRGFRCYLVEVSKVDINALVTRGFLDRIRRDELGAIEQAIGDCWTI